MIMIMIMIIVSNKMIIVNNKKTLLKSPQKTYNFHTFHYRRLKYNNNNNNNNKIIIIIIIIIIRAVGVSYNRTSNAWKGYKILFVLSDNLSLHEWHLRVLAEEEN